MEKLKKPGEFFKEDLKNLQKIDPEYATNLILLLEKQDLQKKTVNAIQEKIAKNSLLPEDIDVLEKVDPVAAEKLESALKGQLKSKVSEIEQKLKTVKTAIENQFNNTATNPLREKMKDLGGTLKQYDQKELEKLHVKILRSKVTAESIFDKVLKRLDLDYNIQNLIESSKDIPRVLKHFLKVLPKFNVPLILQKSAGGIVNGLIDLQEWFETIVKIYKQAINKCGKTCGNSIPQLINATKTYLSKFNVGFCKVRWTVGVKVFDIVEMCLTLTKLNEFMISYKFQNGNFVQTIERNIVQPLNNIVTQWKSIRKEMRSIYKQQWKSNIETINILNNYKTVISTLENAFSNALGKEKLDALSDSELIAFTDAYLSQQNSTIVLACYKVLIISFLNIVSAIENLPIAIQRNKKARLVVDTNQIDQLISSFNAITDNITISVTSLCSGKIPISYADYKIMLNLTQSTKEQLQNLLQKSKSVKDLFLHSQKFSERGKLLSKKANQIKSSLLPCKLENGNREKNFEGMNQTVLRELIYFMSYIKPIAEKSVQHDVNSLKDIIGQFEDGITCPVGELLRTMNEFISQSVEFNICLMFIETPKTGALIANSVKEYFKSAKQFFIGVLEISNQCGTGCKPDEVFGKSNLKKISKQLDQKLEPVSRKAKTLMDVINFTPRGMPFLLLSIEKIRVSLQKMHVSSTGFTRKGILNIISGFEKVESSAGDIRNNLLVTYGQFTSVFDKNINILGKSLARLKRSLSLIYKRSNLKLKYIQEIREKTNQHEKELTYIVQDYKINENIIERRYDIVKKSTIIISDIAGHFHYIYSSNIDDTLESFVDKNYAAELTLNIENIRSSSGKILEQTNKIIDVVGVNLPKPNDLDLFTFNFSKIIHEMVNSNSTQKIIVAKKLKSLCNNLKQKTLEYIEMAKVHNNIANGKVGNCVYERYESVKEKLKKLEKLFGEIGDVINETKKNPIIQIGKIKHTINRFIKSLAEYELAMILLADPKILPKKVEEIKHLLNNFGKTMSQIAQMLKNCSNCTAINIFGYNYLRLLTLKLNNVGNVMFKNIEFFRDIIGDKIGELQGLEEATENIKRRFNKIFETRKYDADTFTDISTALFNSMHDINNLTNCSIKLVKILFEHDVEFEVLTSAFKKIFFQLGEVMNRSPQVTLTGEEVYIKAKDIVKQFALMKKNFSKIRQMPLKSRIEVSKELSTSTKFLLRKFPKILKLPKDTLVEAGIDLEWLSIFGESVDGVTKTISNAIAKTNRIMRAAGMAIDGHQNIRSKYADIQEKLNFLKYTSWDNKSLAWKELSSIFGSILHSAIETTLKAKKVLNVSLAKNNLKSFTVSKADKERIEKYDSLLKNISLILNKFQQGPIPSIGTLTDHVEDLLDSLDDYNFGEILLKNPRVIETKLSEFQKLASSAGYILKKLESITSACPYCDDNDVFDEDFMKKIARKIKTKFEAASMNITNVLSRAATEMNFRKHMGHHTEGISANFQGLTKEKIRKDKFRRIVHALLKSAEDLTVFVNQSAKIFESVFKGNKSMEHLKHAFNNLVKRVSHVFNKSPVYLPTVKEVFESLKSAQRVFDKIKGNLSSVEEGSMELRLNIIKQIIKGIEATRTSLLAIFDQPQEVVKILKIDSKWLEGFTKDLTNVCELIFKIVNQTNTVLNGAGIFVKDIITDKGLIDVIAKDLKEIKEVPVDQKSKILQKVLKKVERVLCKTNQIIDQGLLELKGDKYCVTSTLGKITGSISGYLGNLSKTIKKVAVIHGDVLRAIYDIKSESIQKIGKLADVIEEFVSSIKNYNLAVILVQAPKFAKNKVGDFKQIILNVGGILKNISRLVRKHNRTYNLDNLFGSGFINNISGSITDFFINESIKLRNVLDKVEENTGHKVGLVSSVTGLKEQFSLLQGLDFSQDGLQNISDVLLSSSGFLEEMRNGSEILTKILFKENQDLVKLMGNYEGFIKKLSGYLETNENFSKDLSDMFEQFKYLKTQFDKAKSDTKDLTQGPLQNRVTSVKHIVNGVESIMRGFTKILKTSNISVSWLHTFGTQFEGIINDISNILNKTNLIARSLDQTIGNISNIKQTTDIISNSVGRLKQMGSLGNKIQVAVIVSNVKTLKAQVNTLENDVNHSLGHLTGKTLAKIDPFRNRQENILSELSNGLGAVSRRYEQFRELSKIISNAFKSIENDPLSFALNGLLKLFNEADKFTELLLDDVKETARKVGIKIDGSDILNKYIIDSAQFFFKFVQTVINTIDNGAKFVKGFRIVLNSKTFKDTMASIRKLETSGANFIQNVDKLGSRLFKNWNKMKDQFSDTINAISKSLGSNLKEMSTNLENTFNITGDALKTFTNIKNLLNISEFDVGTVMRAANSVIQVEYDAASIAGKIGFKVGADYLQTTNTHINYVMAAYHIYEGIKAFKTWVNDICDLTHEDVVTRRNVSYRCFKKEVAIEKVLQPVPVCNIISQAVLKGYGEAKLCCSGKKCIFMQNESCLKQNKNCSNSKLELLKKLSKVNLPSKQVYEDYLKSSQALSIQEKEVKLKQEIFKAEIYKLKVHNASLFQTKMLLERTINATKDLERQFESIKSLYQAGKSKLKIDRINFNFTITDPETNNVPFEISVNDTNGRISKINTVFNFEKDTASLKSVAQTILSIFLEHIPDMKHQRSIHLITDIGRKSEKLRQWALLCIVYQETFGTIFNAFKILRVELEKATDISNQSSNDNLQSDSLGEIRLGKVTNETSLETINNIIRRWKKTAEAIFTENVGSVCFGFKDCLETQIENLTSIYKPELKSYDIVISYLVMLRSRLIDFEEYAHTRKKQTNIQIVSNIFQLLKNIDVNTYFCDHSPRLKEKMPISAVAYLEEFFELICTIDGPATMDYVWRKNDTILPNHLSWKLRIDNVSQDDHGYYSCEGKISTVSVVSNKVLVQVFRQPLFIAQPVDQIFDYPGGQKLTWVCNGTAEPNHFYKWFFRSYQSVKPILLCESSLLEISHVSQRNIGYYWCEISDGTTKISSRKAKLDVARVIPRKESARVSLKLSIGKSDTPCLLPITEQSDDLLDAVKLTLNSKLGISETQSRIDLLYYRDINNPRSANITLGVSLKQRRDAKADSVNLALEVSDERKMLQEKLSNFLQKLDKGHSLSVYYNNCSVKVTMRTLHIDWRVDDLVCPRGMGTSKDNLKCGK